MQQFNFDLEWTPAEIEALKAAAAMYPMDCEDRFIKIAEHVPGKQFYHCAEKMHSMNIDGFNCHRCHREVSHVLVFSGSFYQHGNMRFCSLACRDGHIAE